MLCQILCGKPLRMTAHAGVSRRKSEGYDETPIQSKE
jgi:hypothetical protein